VAEQMRQITRSGIAAAARPRLARCSARLVGGQLTKINEQAGCGSGCGRSGCGPGVSSLCARRRRRQAHALTHKRAKACS
jgi:hypothetical protein